MRIHPVIIIIISLYGSTAGCKPPPTFSIHPYQLLIYSRLLQQNIYFISIYLSVCHAFFYHPLVASY